jgi:transposase
VLTLGGSARLLLWRGAVDLRKSIRGLCAVVRAQLGERPEGGAYFVFVNRRRNRVKILYWDRDGFCVWYKALERGHFLVPPGQGATVRVERRELTLLLEGVVPLRLDPRFQLAVDQ